MIVATFGVRKRTYEYTQNLVYNMDHTNEILSKKVNETRT